MTVDTEIPSDWKWHKAVGDSAEWCAERRSPRMSDVIVGAGALCFTGDWPVGALSYHRAAWRVGDLGCHRAVSAGGAPCLSVWKAGSVCLGQHREILGCQRGMWAVRTRGCRCGVWASWSLECHHGALCLESVFVLESGQLEPLV